MKNQKGFIIVVLTVLVVVAALAVIGYGFYIKNKSFLMQTGSGSQTPVAVQNKDQNKQAVKTAAPIQNAGELDSVSTGLDSTDTTQLDTQLDLLNSGTSSF